MSRRAKSSRSVRTDETKTLLAAALETFRERGYSETTLEVIAQRAARDIAQVQSQFADKEALLVALLQAYSPQADLEAALDRVEGETAEDLLRDAMRRLTAVTEQHVDFFELAVIDAQVNGGTFLAGLSSRLFTRALDLLSRIKATGELRPVADVILGRTLISLLIGFVISERAMPQVARLAMRLFPQRAWLDGMVDLLLYGAIEDAAR